MSNSNDSIKIETNKCKNKSTTLLCIKSFKNCEIYFAMFIYSKCIDNYLTSLDNKT